MLDKPSVTNQFSVARRPYVCQNSVILGCIDATSVEQRCGSGRPRMQKNTYDLQSDRVTTDFVKFSVSIGIMVSPQEFRLSGY